MAFIFLLLVAVVGLIMFSAARKKFQTMRNQTLRTSMNLAATITVLALIGAFSQTITVVPAGHVGVVDDDGSGGLLWH